MGTANGMSDDMDTTITRTFELLHQVCDPRGYAVLDALETLVRNYDRRLEDVLQTLEVASSGWRMLDGKWFYSAEWLNDPKETG
jgi:hypothetical protein